MTWGLGTKYIIDFDTTQGWLPRRVLDSLAEGFVEFEKLPRQLRYRLRGPNNKIYAETNEGKLFRHDPPRTYKNNP
jgi:hypothetical protein